MPREPQNLLENAKLLVQLYYRPVSAANRILDHGSVAFALVASVLTAVLLHLPTTIEGARGASLFPPVVAMSQEATQPAAPSIVRWAAERFVAYDSSSVASSVLGLLFVYVPVSILIIARWDCLGSGSVILRRDYMPVLACTLMAWTAAYLPLALARSVVGSGLRSQLPAALWYAASLYFAGLSCICLRTVFGTSLSHSAVASLAAWTASIGGIVFYLASGPLFYYLLSPCYLFYGCRIFQADFTLITGGLRSRQSFRRYLEASTINPRDADSHYQLGLIYQQRRNYTEAIARFAKAVEIDRSEPDPHYQLGRLAREQGRLEDAYQHLKAAASLDEKHSSSEVWRDIGAVCVELSREQEALQALDKYVARRPYDPEGLYWYGVALKKLDEPAQAREAFERTIEAVDTMPSHRRGLLRKWGTQARDELRGLSKSG